MDRFTRINQLKIHVVLRHTKIQATMRPEYSRLEIWSDVPKAAQKKGKQEWTLENFKARQCARTEKHFIRRSRRWRAQGNHENRKESRRYRWRRLCQAKYERRRSFLESRGKPTTKPNNPTKCRKMVNRFYQKMMKIHISEKGFHCNLTQKIVSILQEMRIPDAEAAVDKEWVMFDKLQAWQLND